MEGTTKRPVLKKGQRAPPCPVPGLLAIRLQRFDLRANKREALQLRRRKWPAQMTWFESSRKLSVLVIKNENDQRETLSNKISKVLYTRSLIL